MNYSLIQSINKSLIYTVKVCLLMNSLVNMSFTVRKMFYYNRYVNLNVKCQTIREDDILLDSKR